jgi:hypothetical protein
MIQWEYDFGSDSGYWPASKEHLDVPFPVVNAARNLALPHFM